MYIPIVCSSVLLNSIPQYGYIMVFNNSSMEGLLNCFQFCTIINIDAVKVLVMTSCNTHFFSFFCGKCPGVQSLSHMASSVLLETAKPLSTEAVPSASS